MLGFADLPDLALVTGDDVAARMGYASWASLRRALRRAGAHLPRALARNRFRACDVKDWFAALPAPSITITESGRAAGEGRPRLCPQSTTGALISLDEARRRLRAS